jgi:hypothetical protein
VSSALTSLVKLVKMKMSSPHESRSVVLYSVVVFNQSGLAIGTTSADNDLFGQSGCLYSVVVFNQSGLAIGTTSADNDLSTIYNLLLVYKS